MRNYIGNQNDNEALDEGNTNELEKFQEKRADDIENIQKEVLKWSCQNKLDKHVRKKNYGENNYKHMKLVEDGKIAIKDLNTIKPNLSEPNQLMYASAKANWIKIFHR